MRATRSLVVAALAAAGLAAGAAQAATHMGGGGHASSGSHGSWQGGSGGWHGGNGGWHGGSSWHGGWHGGHVFYGGPRASFWWGWPLAFGPWYWWGYPYDYYYGSYAYPAYPAPAYPDGVMSAPESEAAPVPPGPGAPTQGPTYMNYCESARAYFPKVTTCPEGWKFVPAR